MNKAFGLSYKEIKSILIIVLILTFIFGFNDNSVEFVLKNWSINLFYVFLLVFLVVLSNTLGYKLAAKYLGTEAEIKVWNSSKFNEKFQLKRLYNYILSPILPILVTLFSNGKLFFSPVSTFEIKNESVYGRKFPKLTHFNLGLIAVSGLFFNFILMIFFKIFNLEEGIIISSWFIIWNLLPISELPGAKIFFASRTMYFFSLIFFILNILLIQTFPIITSIILSLLFSIILAIIYFYLIEYLKS